MSILDRLRSQLGQQQGVANTDETQRVEELKAGTTGKAAPAESGPRTSRLAERIALGQARGAEQEQAKKEQIQSEQLKLAEDAQLQSLNDQQLAQVEQSLDTKQQLSQRTNQLLNELERGTKQLDFQRDAAQYEQIGFDIRMNNRKYIDSLNAAAQRAQLNDAARFKEELQKAIFDDERSLFDSNLEFRRMMDADARDFAREVSQISIEQALEIARAQTDAANTLGKYQSIGTVIQAGAQGYSTYSQQQAAEERAQREKELLGG